MQRMPREEKKKKHALETDEAEAKANKLKKAGS